MVVVDCVRLSTNRPKARLHEVFPVSRVLFWSETSIEVDFDAGSWFWMRFSGTA